jgi:hypothetical protein
MLAVPGLIDLGYDPSRVYQVLREITNEHMGNDPAAWKNWYSTAGANTQQSFGAASSGQCWRNN